MEHYKLTTEQAQAILDAIGSVQASGAILLHFKDNGSLEGMTAMIPRTDSHNMYQILLDVRNNIQQLLNSLDGGQAMSAN